MNTGVTIGLEPSFFDNRIAEGDAFLACNEPSRKVRVVWVITIAGCLWLCGAVARAQSHTQSRGAARPSTSCSPTLPQAGEVLIAGGNAANGRDITAAAELFNPTTQTFASACTMTAPRFEPQVLTTGSPTAQVLVLGGQTESSSGKTSILKTTDSLSLLTGQFTKGPEMKKVEYDGVAVQLKDGRWFVTVGWSNHGTRGGVISSNRAMIYDPAKNKFSTVKKKMISSRASAAAALINGCSCASDGKVLIAGGSDGSILASAELFDPVTNSFEATGNMNAAREWETATALADGTVLVAGGLGSSGSSLNTAEIYNPLTGTFAFTAAPMIVERSFHTATLLQDGTVLIAGGLNGAKISYSVTSAEVYDPLSQTFALTAHSMTSSRYHHSATLLSTDSGALNGQVLLAGGDSLPDTFVSSVLSTAELFNPVGQTFTPTLGNMLSPHAGHAAAAVP